MPFVPRINYLSNEKRSNFNSGSNKDKATKRVTRKKPWGNQSYAELITQAIDSSREKRMTLSQIYEYIIRNVPYFQDKGDSKSSSGWKNSIRHNLSLHNRFQRVQDDISDQNRCSFWKINPAAGSQNTPRRRSARSRRRSRGIIRQPFPYKPSYSNTKRSSFYNLSLLRKNCYSAYEQQNFSNPSSNVSMSPLLTSDDSLALSVELQSQHVQRNFEEISCGSDTNYYFKNQKNTNSSVNNEVLQQSKPNKLQGFLTGDQPIIMNINNYHQEFMYNVNFVTDNQIPVKNGKSVSCNAVNSNNSHFFINGSQHNKLNDTLSSEQRFSFAGAECFTSSHHLSGSFVTTNNSDYSNSSDSKSFILNNPLILGNESQPERENINRSFENSNFEFDPGFMEVIHKNACHSNISGEQDPGTTNYLRKFNSSCELISKTQFSNHEKTSSFKVHFGKLDKSVTLTDSQNDNDLCGKNILFSHEIKQNAEKDNRIHQTSWNQDVTMFDFDDANSKLTSNKNLNVESNYKLSLQYSSNEHNYNKFSICDEKINEELHNIWKEHLNSNSLKFNLCNEMSWDETINPNSVPESGLTRKFENESKDYKGGEEDSLPLDESLSKILQKEENLTVDIDISCPETKNVSVEKETSCCEKICSYLSSEISLVKETDTSGERYSCQPNITSSQSLDDSKCMHVSLEDSCSIENDFNETNFLCNTSAQENNFQFVDISNETKISLNERENSNSVKINNFFGVEDSDNIKQKYIIESSNSIYMSKLSENTQTLNKLNFSLNHNNYLPTGDDIFLDDLCTSNIVTMDSLNEQPTYNTEWGSPDSVFPEINLKNDDENLMETKVQECYSNASNSMENSEDTILLNLNDYFGKENIVTNTQSKQKSVAFSFEESKNEFGVNKKSSNLKIMRNHSSDYSSLPEEEIDDHFNCLKEQLTEESHFFNSYCYCVLAMKSNKKVRENYFELENDNHFDHQYMPSNDKYSNNSMNFDSNNNMLCQTFFTKITQL